MVDMREVQNYFLSFFGGVYFPDINIEKIEEQINIEKEEKDDTAK